MKTKIAILALALGASTGFLMAQDGPPPGETQPPAQHQGGPGGHGGFHLLPPRAMEQLKLTDDQKAQVTALEAETKAKLEKILTPEQLQQLKTMRPSMRQGGAGGGQMHGDPGGPGQGNGPDAGDNGLPPGPPPGNN